MIWVKGGVGQAVDGSSVTADNNWVAAGSHVGGRTHRAGENRGIRHLENAFTPRDVPDRGGEGKLVAYTATSSRQVARKPAKARA